MNSLVLMAFSIELEKLAAPPSSAEPPGGYERMNKAKWKQTFKDMGPLVLGGGLGYGIGRTVGSLIAQKGQESAARGASPSWMKGVPAGLAISGVLAGYGMTKLKKELKKRREQASLEADALKHAGVAPPVQSRGIPPRKRSDPWRYDPRPAGML